MAVMVAIWMPLQSLKRVELFLRRSIARDARLYQYSVCVFDFIRTRSFLNPQDPICVVDRHKKKTLRTLKGKRAKATVEGDYTPVIGDVHLYPHIECGPARTLIQEGAG